jgi:hypothetical protein
MRLPPFSCLHKPDISSIEKPSTSVEAPSMKARLVFQTGYKALSQTQHDTDQPLKNEMKTIFFPPLA